ncbi:PIN/TRAM domain-containing protein [Chloroflexota bacterium]
MSLEFTFRLIGMVVFGIAGVRLGVVFSDSLALPSDGAGLLLGLTGTLFGLIATPWLTTRPIRAAQRLLLHTPTETVVLAFTGLMLGLVPALLLTFPISLLPVPLGNWGPVFVAIFFGYLGMTVFAVRANDVIGMVLELRDGKKASVQRDRILLDTSVIIDGRIQDIAEAGFMNWTLVVPRFVLEELQHIADSADMLRRNRGKRGLDVLRELKRMDYPVIEIIDEDVPDVAEVDHKLIMLGREKDMPVMTNDFNLNQIARLQGVTVLNINVLANSVRAEFIPGEIITLKVIQEGKEHDQGVGYLQDGTMVVIEGGKRYLDRTTQVEITRLISREAGKMYFARPAAE